MLEELLKEIRSGGTLETRSLAKKLGVSAQMVDALLEHLQRSGQIRPYNSCADGCQGCGLKGDCGIQSQARLWQSGDS